VCQLAWQLLVRRASFDGIDCAFDCASFEPSGLWRAVPGVHAVVIFIGAEDDLSVTMFLIEDTASNRARAGQHENLKRHSAADSAAAKIRLAIEQAIDVHPYTEWGVGGPPKDD
jgi:hypothetical protein